MLAGMQFSAGWHCHLVEHSVDKGRAIGDMYDVKICSKSRIAGE
jgi:hypothetical protein